MPAAQPLQLIADYGLDDEVTQIRDGFNWYIEPVVNPDGYEYTWTTVGGSSVYRCCLHYLVLQSCSLILLFTFGGIKDGVGAYYAAGKNRKGDSQTALSRHFMY